MIIPIDIHGLQLFPVFEYRIRLERRLEPDFSWDTNDDRYELDNRLRAGFDVKHGKDLTGEARFQYSQETFWTRALNYSHESRDLLLGHLDMKRNEGTYSLGRQFITKGDRRLLDVSNFGQRSKVFDVVRFRGIKWDIFGGRVGVAGSNENDHSKIVGATYDSAFGETLGFWKRDDSDTNISHVTLDQRKVFQLGSTSLALEGAYQFGKVADLDQRAFWLHTRVNHPLNKQLKLYAEGNLASGGQSSDVSKTFDPLYGTGHAPYGLMDVQGLKNLKHFELGVTAALSKRFSALASYNRFYLFDKTDGWYGTGGNLNRRPGGRFIDSTGKSGDDVGQEFDVSFDYAISKTQNVTLELGLFKPGDFVKTLVGPNTDDQRWGLLSYNTRF